MQNMSNHFKAVLYQENLLDNDRIVEKDKCPTVQSFSYQCQRSRNDAGFPYGDTLPAELDFSIRVGNSDDGKDFYKQLQQNEFANYTFIFNATYDENNRLKSFDDAMVVKGYVVDVREDFDTVESEKGTTEQMLMKVTLLLSSISYVGKEDNYRLLEIFR